MDRNLVEDTEADNISKTTSSQISNISRLTPGKFPLHGDKNVSTVENYDNETNNINNFYLYSTNIDTNAIWNTNKDLKRTYSSPSQNFFPVKEDSKDGHNVLDSIWNSKYNSSDSLTSKDEIGIDINDFNDIESDLSKTTNNDRNHVVAVKENYTSEESKKMVSIINSHEGWGVRPVNQKTPWLIPNTDPNNNSGTYQSTFSGGLFNEAPNGVYIWESYESAKKQSITDCVTVVHRKSGSNYSMMQPRTVWSTVANEGVWSSSTAFSNCGKLSGRTAIANGDSSEIIGRIGDQGSVYKATNDGVMGSCWSKDVARQVTSGQIPLDRYSAMAPPKHIENEMSNLKFCKEAQKQLIEQYQKDFRKIQEIDNNLATLSKLPEGQARPILIELLRRRQTIQQKNQSVQSHLELVSQRIMQLEDVISNYSRAAAASYGGPSTTDNKYSSPTIVHTTASKLESMNIHQPTVYFRPDVPEFIPGKKWCGLSQTGKENRNPTNVNAKISGVCSPATITDPQDVANRPPPPPSSSSTAWLLIQNMPTHITIEMIQSFFVQNNNPCITPIHSNPFARWLLVKFPSVFASQKAYQMLSGKIGQVSLISDLEADLMLQELKSAMTRFVTH